MSATYNSTLSTDLDLVRFLVGDTDITDPALQDEEITAIVALQTAPAAALPYFAAADLLSQLSGKYGAAGKGKVQKMVSKLNIIWGINEDANAALASRISDLRKRGAQLAARRPFVFRIGGNSRTRGFPNSISR